MGKRRGRGAVSKKGGAGRRAKKTAKAPEGSPGPQNDAAGLTALAARYVELKGRIKEGEEEVKGLKDERERVCDKLLDLFAADGIQSISLHGHTIYLFHDIFVSIPKEGRKLACERLKDAGLDFLVQESPKQGDLRAWVKEQPTEEGTEMPVLPPELAEVIILEDVYEIRSKSAPKR